MPGAENKDFSNKDCDKNMEITMLRFEKKLMETAEKITKEFNNVLNSAKNKFATKERVKGLENTVSDIKKLHESRQYDWLKYAIVTAVSILTIILFNK